MLTRDDVKGFLTANSDKKKQEVLPLFISFALADGVSIDKLGKLIADLRSYNEWTWGE